MDPEKLFLRVLLGLLIFLFISLFAGIPILMYDDFYMQPQAAEKANQYCMDKGYDFYEEFDRIGFLSKEPVAIVCKYVEQYRNIDLNINKLN